MFLDVLIRRNPGFLESLREAQQLGRIPANTVVIDSDAVASNALLISEEASKHRLKVFAMTKQIGRNADISKVLLKSGISSAVAVDLECGIAAWNAGLSIGHIGHLVQIPSADLSHALHLEPDYWTVFSAHHANKLNGVLQNTSTRQKVLLRVFQDGDTFYPGHEGGFPLDSLEDCVNELSQYSQLEISGVTSFPTTLFDSELQANVPTQNRSTLSEARTRLEALGFEDVQVNSPGTTSTENISSLAAAGATQVEPGHGLTGTTPMHAVADLPEIPATAYVTEVSHIWNNMAFVYGGGLYVDPVLPGGETFALLADNDKSAVSSWRKRRVLMPDPSSIDYYARIPLEPGETVQPGTTVIFGFRVQAFVTRANTVAFSPNQGRPIGAVQAANGGLRLLPDREASGS